MPDNQVLLVDVAVTERERRRGLSWCTDLPRGRGLLMAFTTPGYGDVTMWNMSIPLDLVWLSADKQVLEFVVVAMPISRWKLTLPEASYVLEIGAGEIRRLGLKLGDVLRF